MRDGNFIVQIDELFKETHTSLVYLIQHCTGFDYYNGVA